MKKESQQDVAGALGHEGMRGVEQDSRAVV